MTSPRLEQLLIVPQPSRVQAIGLIIIGFALILAALVYSVIARQFSMLSMALIAGGMCVALIGGLLYDRALTVEEQR